MKKFKIILLLAIPLFIVFFIILNLRSSRGYNVFSPFPKCPDNLSGVLTYPLMDPKYISALTPLGNINPPGHTSPVDHIYFETTYSSKIPMGAPADATITSITTISKEITPGKYEVEGYTIKYVVCAGLELDFANYNDVVDPIKQKIVQMGEKDCRRDIKKGGHGDKAQGQCYYRVNIPVKSGEQVGWVWRVIHPETGDLTLPFEIWAANYNVDPPKQTNWKYYDDERYAHIMCPFDLYADNLKNQYYSKMGAWEYAAIFDKNGKKTTDPSLPGHFVARNGKPLCGQVDQDLTGTIQGMWFSKATPKDDYNAKFNGGLAFLHNNIDVTQGEISVGGDLNNGQSGIIFFQPTHSGNIGREPSEVKADGLVYCYDASGMMNGQGKFLVQLVDDHHLKAEIQKGVCSGGETLQKPFNYER
jgi:hypothetical protein